MTSARRDELLLTVEHQPHRPLGGQREVADDVFDEHLLLGAEAPADARLHHPDVLHLQAEQRRHDAPHVERHLSGGAQDESLVLVEPRHRDVRFDRGLLHLVYAVRVLEHPVGRRECGFQRLVADRLRLDVQRLVASSVVNADGIGLVVDRRDAG